MAWNVPDLHNDMLMTRTLRVRAAFLSVNLLTSMNFPKTSEFTRVKTPQGQQILQMEQYAGLFCYCDLKLTKSLLYKRLYI